MKVPLSDNAKLLLGDPEALRKIMIAMSSRHIKQMENPFPISVRIDEQKTINLKFEVRAQ